MLRPATADDAELLLHWRNDPETRAASFQGEEIEFAEHRAWLQERLGDPGCLLFVIEAEGEPAGSVRLERHSPQEAEIHIVLAPEARGGGLAAAALEEASGLAGSELGVERVRARIKADNPGSLRAFESAGFEEAGHSTGVVELTRPASA